MKGHAIMFARFLNVGTKWKHEERVKQAITSEYGPIPLMFGLRKDHKTVPPEEKQEGPPYTSCMCGIIINQWTHVSYNK